MPLELDASCQAAIDLAKQSVDDGVELGAGLLIEALYTQPDLQSRFPALNGYLRAPLPQRLDTPRKVTLASEVRPVFQELSNRSEPLKAEELFTALIKSDPGRAALNARGVPESFFSEMRQPSPERLQWRSSAARRSAIQALSNYGRMLTETAPPSGHIVEREGTIRAMVRTLSRMRRRNAIIAGPPGTGKSVLVYELARRIFNDDPSLPAQIREYDIFELSPTFLRSGTSLVGQYEERIKNLLKVLAENPRILLFIDEIHSMFQSGVYSRGPFSDANESFKGALARGELTCLGCTTLAEYRHSIEPDGALMRRFTLIRLEPPAKEVTRSILEHRRPRMEAYFAPLKIPDAILDEVIALTDDHLASRFQPDKSIQLLDEACAFCVTADPPLAEVTEASLHQALEDLIGHRLVRAETLSEEGVFQTLSAAIVGQDAVLHALARAWVAALGDWAKRSGPRGVFFFGGPTGVGKTKTALELSRIIGGGQKSLVRIDCNTLQGSGLDGGPILNRLLGAPPGYVGYAKGQGGVLSRVRDQPESVFLFDEFEKASPAVGRLLLQIIDNGQIEDADSNPLDFRRAFIILTSNVGCVYDHHHLGFSDPNAKTPSDVPEADLDKVKSELRSRGFGEEFLARLGHLFLFRGLDESAIGTILERKLDALRTTSELKGVDLSWDSGLIAHLTALWQPRFGVRYLVTLLRNRIVEPLGVAEVEGKLKGVETIRLEVQARVPGSAIQPGEGGFVCERKEDTFVVGVC